MNPTDQQTRSRNAAAQFDEHSDLLARARALVPTVVAASDRVERERKLPCDLMAALHEAGMYRLCLPRSLGGMEASAHTIFEVSEIIGQADASTAWCLGQAFGCSMAAAYLDPAAAQQVFGPLDAVLAWGPPNRDSKFVEVEGGYCVTGTWHYASGIHNASWVGAHCRMPGSGDGLRPGPDGSYPNRTFLFPVEQVCKTDVWDVIGLRGTGSDDYAINDQFVPAELTLIQASPRDRRECGPLYRIPVFTFYGIPFSGVALGVARAILDDFMGLAVDKVAYRTTAPVRESPVVQSEVARCEGKLAASRAFLLEVIDEIWQCAMASEEIHLPARTRLRLAVTHAMNEARSVADFAYRAAGGTAVFENQPYARRFRDMNAISQQAQASERNFESVGQALLGLDPQGGRI